MDLIFQIIGILGAAFILICFIMIELNKWKNDDILYDSFNFIGSVLLVINAIYFNSIPFLILNTVWALVSLRDIVKFFIKK